MATRGKSINLFLMDGTPMVESNAHWLIGQA